MPDSQDINNPFLPVDQKTTKKTAQDGFKFDPSTAKPVQNKPLVADVEGFQFDPSTAKAVNKGFSGHARDLGASLMGGLAAVPDIAVGVADLYTGGRAGKAVDNLSDNFKLGQAQKYWQDQKTDQAKVQSQQFADAEGIIDKTKVALSNPSMIANTVTESLPSMAVGGLAGRGINIASKGTIGAAASGAIGEGAVMAGSQAEQIRQKTDDGLLTGKQTAAAAGTGVAGSLLGFLGGTVAKKLGFEDVDTLMAKGVKPEQVAQEITQIPFSSIPKSVVLGAISEGLLEEMPQSVTEQVLQNYALDKDLFEGVDDAIVMGTLAGMAMGGTVAGTSQASKWAGQPNSTNPDTNDDADTTGLNPLLPAPTGGDGGTGLGFDGLQGEYIPAGQQGTTDPVQARQNFEYDQMPTDAERQIEFGGLSRQYALTPSEQMGIDPNVGPLSSAAATAVDTGISQQFQIEMQAQAASEASPNPAGKTEDNNAPLQQAAETARQLTPEQIHGTQNKYSPEVISALETLRQRQQGEQSGSVTLNESTQNEATQRGNAQTDNGSQPLSEQYDTNATSAMGTVTGAAQDGLQPTQFDASQVVSPNQSVNKTQTSEAKSKLLDTQSKVTELEAQLATEKSVPKKAQLRKQIAKLQQDSPIDQAAHAAATSIQNDLPEPTQAQIEAGNYKKGHINVHGLNIAVENPRGSERRGTNPDGEEWAHNMSDHYGYIKRTTGADNEQIDTYVGRNPESDQVFIVDQIDQQTGGFDEHKVMLGFNSQEDAVQAYSSNFDDGWKVGPVRTMTQDEFKSWLKDGDTKKPASDTQVQPIAGTLMSEEGKTEKVYTPSNREIEVRHKLVEADSLIASNHGNGSINENFPQELQPRDRTRPSSQAQVNDIANNLNPKLLGNSPSTANGAPIVSKDNIVESGNGRIMAVRKAYEQGKGEAYKQWLSEQGYDVSKMKNPVLVRERVTELSDQDRIAYTKESNERTTLDLSPTERAIADADSISNILEDYAGGDLNSTANRTFVNKFVTGVVSTNERAAVIGADKALTQQGKRRIQGALVAAAYGDSTIINQVFEDTDSEIKAIGNALTDVAGVWGLMRKMAQQGSIPAELDITPNLIEAVHLVHKARTEKRKLIELVAQDDIFAGAIDQVTKDFLSIFYRGDKYTQARSREKVADALSYYANQAQQIKPGTNLFGEEPQTETDLIRETNERQQNQEANKQQDIFTSPQSNDSNAAKTGGTGQRTAAQGTDVKAQSTQGLDTLTQIQSDSGLTHSIPSKLMDQAHKLGSVVNDLASMQTNGVKTNVLYGKQLLAKLAKLNPDVHVHIVSDLNSIKDNTIRANLNAGGFYVPEQNTAYFYPQSGAWESSALELLNHELVHAVTERSIFAGQISQNNLNKINEIIDGIKEYTFENYSSLTEHVNDRLDYATTTNPTHEILAVGIAETEVRQALQSILGADGLQQLDSIFTEISTEQEKQNEQRKQNGNPREHSKGNTKNVPEPADGITEEVSGGATSTETDRGFKRNTSNPSGNLSGNESSQSPSTVNKTIQDFGEKIGGARKDTAVKTGKKSTTNKEKDDRPTWAKRYEISEIAASLNPEENGKWIISDTRKKDWKGQNRIVTKERFNTQAEAEAALPLIAVAQKHRVWTGGKETFAIYREISDRKRVKVVEQEFKTHDEAMQYMASHAVEILETNTTFGEIDLPRPENIQRKGTARRTEDAKDSDFTKVFGFRGVEFGNWNNQVERQELLNDAFDGLIDLAEVLNIPPEAISLNGELALAFGARGHGLSGAAAHYEPERVVINLTKMNGAGSLAHEWWHALDHYFGRQDGKASSAWITNADGSRSLKIQKRFEDMSVTSGFSRQSNVREDVQNAYNELVKTIFKKSETYVEDTIRVESFVSGARENLKSKLDQLRNDLNRELDPKYYKRFNKAASAEQLAEFDTVVELLLTGTALSTELRYSESKNSRNVFSGARWSNDALDKLSAIYKAVRGRSGFNAEQKGILDQVRQYMNAFSQRLKLLAEAQQGTEKAKMIPTNFAMNAKELDQGRGTDYWITTPEMTARAFQGYVEDKIAARSAYSPFLNYAPEAAAILTPWGFKRPYPTGDERVKINKAFDTLIDNFKTEKTEQGTKLYSRAENPAASSTVAQVREALVSRFGEKTIADLEAQGILNIIQDQLEGMTGNVEGWYENGKVTLVASNLDADSAVATFLHELGGHAGFQNLMNKDAYADLMQQFERMVAQGNPVALEAKRLAERELNREVQLDEYLPYMITLASQMQTKNILQKGAIKRFMDQMISAVKAWLYDKGIKLNLNEKDVLALAERMIKAQSNTAAANNQNEDMRFSRQFNAQQTLDNIMNGIKVLNVQSTKNWADNKWTDWLGIALSGLGRRQLTEIYSKILPPLNKYNELAAQMDADKNDAGAEADTIVREWSNLKDDSQLADLMHDATLAKIDPAKPHVAGDSIIKYKQLRDDFNALSPEAQDIYLKARDAYKKHYAKVHQAIKERILRSELSNTKKAELLKDMDNQFFGYVKGVYFPLARFGKYVVIVRNQNGQVESVSRAETMAEAQKSRTEMMKKFPLWKVDRVILDKEFNASRDGVGRGFMSSLFSEVDNLGLSTAEQAEFEDTLSQLYLSSMPDLSWAKHGIHRKGTAGFSQDARRAFAQNMFHGAGYLAKLRYADQMAEQLDEMQKFATEQAKINPEYDQPKAQRVIDEMNKRHENLMNPKSHPLSSMLTSVGFIYYLGLSPAAAMVNLSQTPLVAYPIMGAKWGFDNAAKELLKASNDFRKGVEFHKVKWEGTKTDLYKAVSADISKFLNKDEQQAYKDAVDRGVIDVTQAHDLAGIAQGEDSGVMWKIRPIMRAASTMFHTAERFNREVTFIAAYRLSRQTGATHDTAFAQAVDATYKGHFDYSSGNRPRIMQGNVAKVLLLFKQFGQNMIYTLSRQTYQSIKGETETERKEARRALGAVLGMHAAFAGVLGLPLVGFLLGAASWMGGDDDDPWDAEIALRNYLAETFNPTISNLIMKGVPRAVTPIDMSGRVGINNLLLPDVQEGLEGKRWAESAMSAALGPVAGIGTNMVKGAQEISEGHNLRGVETMLPVFLKNFAKTYRYSDEGVQDKTGVSIMDEVSSMDLLVQGMGFSPSDVRTANEGKSAIFNANRKLNERRSSLMTLWSRAKMMDDQEEMDNVWEEIQGFNEKNPTRRITRMNLNQSYRNRKRRVDRAEDGVYLNHNQQGAREAGAFAFGE